MITELIGSLKEITSELEIIEGMMGTNALLQRPLETLNLVQLRLYDTFENFNQMYREAEQYFLELKTQVEDTQITNKKKIESIKTEPTEPVKQDIEVRPADEDIADTDAKNIDATEKIQEVNEDATITNKSDTKPKDLDDDEYDDDSDEDDDFISEIKNKMK